MYTWTRELRAAVVDDNVRESASLYQRILSREHPDFPHRPQQMMGFLSSVLQGRFFFEADG